MVRNKYDFRTSCVNNNLFFCRLDAELEDEFSSSAEECDKNDSGNSSSNLAAENSTQPIEESADVGLHTTELQKT